MFMSKTSWFSVWVAMVGLSVPVFVEANGIDEPAADAKENEKEENEGGFGAGRKKAEDKPARGKGKKAKDKDEAPAEEEKDEDMPADEKKEADPAAPPAEENEDGGFGAGRNKDGKSNKIDPAELESNKEKAKYVKTIAKKFKKDDGYYVLETLEIGLEVDKDAARQPENKDKAAAVMKPYKTSKFETLAGKDEAVGYVVKFMSEHGEPWVKKRGSGRKEEGSALGPPRPQRDWRLVNWFETAELAEQFCLAEQQRRDAAAAAEAERMKPNNGGGGRR